MKISHAARAHVVRVAILLAVLFGSLAFSACEDSQAKAVAANIDRLAVLIADAREVRDALVEQRLIDNQTAYDLTGSLQRVNSALKVFNTRARAYAAAGDQSDTAKADLRALAQTIAGAAADLVNNGAIGIKNPDQQAKYNAAISAIKQATLAIVDAVERLKTKAPIQKADLSVLGLLPLLLQSVRQLLAFADREAARRGKTPEEVFEEAGIQLDANELALIQDRIKYAPAGQAPTDNDTLPQ